MDNFLSINLKNEHVTHTWIIALQLLKHFHVFMYLSFEYNSYLDTKTSHLSCTGLSKFVYNLSRDLFMFTGKSHPFYFYFKILISSISLRIITPGIQFLSQS